MAKSTCSVIENGKPCGKGGKMVRGWCGMHYRRWWKYGDPLRVYHLPWPENLLQRMEPQPNGCIWFTGRLNPDGYGTLKRDGREWRAHRAAYEHFVGPIPEGMTVDHECHNADLSCAGGRSCLHRRCVNWEHLAPKPIGENTAASPHTLTSINARKTRCPQCHAYDSLNVRGDRICSICAKQAKLRWSCR